MVAAQAKSLKLLPENPRLSSMERGKKREHTRNKYLKLNKKIGYATLSYSQCPAEFPGSAGILAGNWVLKKFAGRDAAALTLRQWQLAELWLLRLLQWHQGRIVSAL